MKEKKIYERRWLHHADNDPKIFESDEIRKALKEGWKFWPWECLEAVKTIPDNSPKEGHGHVVPRSDGTKEECGGPSSCDECGLEQLQLEEDNLNKVG